MEPLGVRAHRRHRPTHLRLPTVLRASRRPVRGAPRRDRRSSRAARLLDRVFADVRPDLAVLRDQRRRHRARRDDDSGHLQPHRRHPIREGTRARAGRRDLRPAAPGRHRRARARRDQPELRLADRLPGHRLRHRRHRRDSHSVDTAGGPDRQTCPRRTQGPQGLPRDRAAARCSGSCCRVYSSAICTTR